MTAVRVKETAVISLTLDEVLNLVRDHLRKLMPDYIATNVSFETETSDIVVTAEKKV